MADQLALPMDRCARRDARGDAGVARADTVADHRAKAGRRPIGTIWRSNPREQGLIGLTDAVGWFGANGYTVSVPLVDAQPYDLVVDGPGGLQRVQVKTTTYRNRAGRFVVKLATDGGNQSFHTRKRFDPNGCELLFVLTDDGSRYLIPTTAIRSTNTLTLGSCVRGYLVAP